MAAKVAFVHTPVHGSWLNAVEVDGGEGCVEPTFENALAGRYTPLSRPLFIYTRESLLRERPDLRLLDGGRAKWETEGRPMTTDAPERQATDYPVVQRDDARIRAFREDVLAHLGKPLIDVRSPDEYTGKLLHMANYPQEGALRGGHIPGAANVPWKRAANDDGTFKTVDELKAIYEGELGLGANDDIVAYCRIGERSSHSWFVLKYLLGYKDVVNYDGSWTEWGNLVGAPVEKGAASAKAA